MSGKGKRTFKVLQRSILKALKNRPLSLNELSKKSGVNWNSTARQLILLKGTERVKEVFSHKRLRVFEITKKGRRTLK